MFLSVVRNPLPSGEPRVALEGVCVQSELVEILLEIGNLGDLPFQRSQECFLACPRSACHFFVIRPRWGNSQTGLDSKTNSSVLKPSDLQETQARSFTEPHRTASRMAPSGAGPAMPGGGLADMSGARPGGGAAESGPFS